MRLLGWVGALLLVSGLGGGCGSASNIEEGVPKNVGYVPPPPVMPPNMDIKSFARSPKQVKAQPPPATEPGKTP
jgi:hypothetical protein